VQVSKHVRLVRARISISAKNKQTRKHKTEQPIKKQEKKQGKNKETNKQQANKSISQKIKKNTRKRHNIFFLIFFYSQIL